MVERNYTCTDYREEMRLLGLKRRLREEELSKEERAEVLEEIARLEAGLEMD
ncbi:MAG: hypothetical protein JRF59_02360 [Deltaproteobacteria bacterium]|nr:hypothetical protein [Deltaproteobacteria bacterium]MBW1923112.1 hypothetical protein [Deltaproteobacteria bacterium]MBW1949648.1 hypothetical protein [Deltaproteobacteria bacterium]MBW2009290.1 hypothetical protein [Deltaproteobacteria bacterium]MBW2346672.1 hypothetical protein [Deltaproteobacteria bacterium]